MKLAELSRQAREFTAVRGKFPVAVRIGDADARQMAEEIYEIMPEKRRPPNSDHVYRSLLKGRDIVAGIKILVDEHRAEDNFYFTSEP